MLWGKSGSHLPYEAEAYWDSQGKAGFLVRVMTPPGQVKLLKTVTTERQTV